MAKEPDALPALEIQAEDVEQVLKSPLVSDHVRMQWKLASLGLKAGEKVWVPTADQGKLRAIYDFNEFELEFAAGIDLPKNYFDSSLTVTRTSKADLRGVPLNTSKT